MLNHALALLLALVLSGCLHSPPMARSEVASPAKIEEPGAESSEPGPHYVRARELYALGPTKAHEILAELDLELRDRPGNVKALLLKATTQIGIEQLDAALGTLDRISELDPDTVYPRAILLRARCLYFKEDYKAAKQALEPYWAFFQDDPESQSDYDSLMATINVKL